MGLKGRKWPLSQKKCDKICDKSADAQNNWGSKTETHFRDPVAKTCHTFSEKKCDKEFELFRSIQFCGNAATEGRIDLESNRQPGGKNYD